MIATVNGNRTRRAGARVALRVHEEEAPPEHALAAGPAFGALVRLLVNEVLRKRCERCGRFTQDGACCGARGPT